MHHQRELDLHLTRRQLFGLTARGIGVAALGSLLGPGAAVGRAGAQATRDPKTGGLAGLPHFAPQGEARHLPAPVRRTVAARDVRLQAGARAVPGHADSRLRPAGAARRPDDGAVVAAGRQLDVRVRAARPVGHVGQRAAAAHREDRRRHHRHQDDEHGRDQPRSGDHVHPDGISAAGPAEHGRVAELRPGQREPDAAGVRRPALAGARASTPISRCSRGCGRAGSCRRAIRASGSAPAARRCCSSRIRPASARTTRREMLDAVAKLNADEARGVRRSGNRNADRAVRDGLPHADVGART